MTKILAMGRAQNGLPVPIAVDENGKIILSASGPQEFASLIVGDFSSGNYFEVEPDGTFVLYGEATTWRDEFGPLIGQRLESPGSDIVQNLANGSLTFESSARYPTDYVAYSLQLNHDWLKSNVEFHVHWEQQSADDINWLVEYRWQINGQSKETSWSQYPLTNKIFTYSSGTLIQINDAGEGNEIIPPSTAYLSEIFQVRLYRDYTNASGLFSSAETNGLNIEALFSDMHRQSNSLGSREEYTK